MDNRQAYLYVVHVYIYYGRRQLLCRQQKHDQHAFPIMLRTIEMCSLIRWQLIMRLHSVYNSRVRKYAGIIDKSSVSLRKFRMLYRFNYTRSEFAHKHQQENTNIYKQTYNHTNTNKWSQYRHRNARSRFRFVR